MYFSIKKKECSFQKDYQLKVIFCRASSLTKKRYSVQLVTLGKEVEAAHYPECTGNKGTFHSSLPVSCSRLWLS